MLPSYWHVDFHYKDKMVSQLFYPYDMTPHTWKYSIDIETGSWIHYHVSVLIQGLHPANERRRYKVTPFLIGWVQT